MNLILDKKIILCRAGSVPGPAHNLVHSHSMETAEASEGRYWQKLFRRSLSTVHMYVYKYTHIHSKVQGWPWSQVLRTHSLLCTCTVRLLLLCVDALQKRIHGGGHFLQTPARTPIFSLPVCQ